MGVSAVRIIASVLVATATMLLFSSCSNVEFAENPVAQCNGSGFSCTSAVENGRKVNKYAYNYAIPYPKADILFVVDNSASMRPEQIKLANAFTNFSSALNAVDWRMAITTTDMSATGLGGKLASIATSSGSVKILNSSIPNYEAAFSTAISGQGDSGDNDERGLLSALRVVENASATGFPRIGSHTAVVVLSDEDERSVGGTTGFELLSTEEPRGYVDRMNALLKGGAHSLYSIIIRPGDVGPGSCLESQLTPLRGYEGKKYFGAQQLIAQELYGVTLNALTSPEVGNICASNYNSIVTSIAASLKTLIVPVTLPCDPIFDAEIGDKIRVVSRTSGSAMAFNLVGRQLSILPTPNPGQEFDLTYTCYAN